MCHWPFPGWEVLAQELLFLLDILGKSRTISAWTWMKGGENGPTQFSECSSCLPAPDTLPWPSPRLLSSTVAFPHGTTEHSRWVRALLPSWRLTSKLIMLQNHSGEPGSSAPFVFPTFPMAGFYSPRVCDPSSDRPSPDPWDMAERRRQGRLLSRGMEEHGGSPPFQ